MTCDELGESYDTYALGFTDEESAEIRDHLRRDCPHCVPGVQRSAALIAQLAWLVKLVDPPARLRGRILALVNPAPEQTRERGFGWSMLFAGTSILLLAVAVVLGLQTQRLTAVRRAETVRLEEALGVMNDSDSREISFGKSANQPPSGRVIVNARRGVVLIASHLPPLPEGKTFEMWLIPRGAKPIPSVLFRAQSNGTALTLQPGAVPADLGTVAVTVEDEAGVTAPTTTPIIAAESK